jgi:hypothetical protein
MREASVDLRNQMKEKMIHHTTRISGEIIDGFAFIAANQ